jgi:hypothetical protein
MNQSALPAAPPNEQKRISKKVRTAIDAMVAGDVKTITDAANKAGLSREHLSRELSHPHVTEHLRQKVVRSLALASARAGATKIELLDSKNELVRDRASSFVLGLVGIQPDTAPAAHPGSQQTPGLIIVINNGSAAPRVIEPPAGRVIDGHDTRLAQSSA